MKNNFETNELLTDSQKKVYEALEVYIEKNGIPPTTRELADILGISAASVFEQMNRLEKKGYIKRQKNRARSIELSKSHKTTDKPAEINLIRIPVLGTISAGEPLYAFENPEKEILVDASSIGTGRFFALTIKGDSMIGAGINDRSLVIVRRQPVAESNEIIAALLGDEATVKRLRIEKDRVLLVPENEKYEPIDVTLREDFKILGKVVTTVNL